MNTKEAKAWLDIVWAVQNGDTPNLNSAIRRSAITEVGKIVRVVSAAATYVTQSACVDTVVRLRSNKITPELRATGYIAKISSTTQDSGDDYGFMRQELHITREQLEGLHEQIGLMLQEGEGHE